MAHRHFGFDALARRDYLDPIEIRRIIRRPARRRVKPDERIRLWGYVGGYLRVVLLSDGETVHSEDHKP